MDKPYGEQLDTEARIIQAAREEFLEKGLYGARMQDIATRAGINKAMLHYYFRSKEKLFSLILEESLRKFFPMVREALVMPLPLRQKLERLIEIYHANLTANPFLPIFILSEAHKNPELFPVKLFEQNQFSEMIIFGQQIRAEMEAGRIRPINPAHFIINLLSLMVFPFLAKPMAKFALNLDETAYQAILSERKAYIMEYIDHVLFTDNQ